MVSIKSLTAAALATGLATASPMISALVAPKTAVAGENVTVTLRTSIYIQNWEDFSIIWGLAPTRFGGQSPAGGEIYVGTQVAYTALYGNDVAKLNNFTVDLAIPENQPTGDWLLVAAVPYLVGASGSTNIRSFNATINITN